MVTMGIGDDKRMSASQRRNGDGRERVCQRANKESRMMMVQTKRRTVPL